MPLKYMVAPRTILLCDFSMGGFKAPEMVKRRPAVVLVGRLPRRDNLLTVVPLSGTESDPRNDYHCRIELEAPLPDPYRQRVWWAKYGVIATVGMKRLELFRTERDHTGQRRYLTQIKVSEDQFASIRTAVRHGLELD